MQKRDPVTGRIVPFADKFPSGMKALGDYIHGLGLRFGVYSDTGNHTCEGYPGSWGHEKLDAATYAEWGVDYLKYDYCDMGGVTESTQVTYTRMSEALAATGRPILFSLCSWGSGQPWQWGSKVGNSWRTGIDVFAVWDAAGAKALKLPSFLQPILGAVRQTQGLASHVGPGGFNDPDMLVVGLDGMYPYGIVQDCPPHVRGCKPGDYISRDRWGKVGGLTQTEQRTHFSFWCIMAAPLILGNDPRAMSKATLQILLAREVLAVNQDPAGLQGKPVWAGGSLEVWAKPLADGRTALLMANLGEATVDITTVFSRDLADESRRWAREVPDSAPPCVDKHPECKGWSDGGECKRNEGGQWQRAEELYRRLQAAGHAPGAATTTALVAGLAGGQQGGRAAELLAELAAAQGGAAGLGPARNVVARALARQGQLDASYGMLRGMMEEEEVVEGSTFTYVAGCCMNAERTELAEDILEMRDYL
ncbi:Alpha-galactosidase [Tetrabaena socialis]|uniref:Alpha-galactosidase n=1 Tax=Tetrabaena socialis TaxID=47790 RepID=A0A2J7ZKU4_9CHLO|nr:Alpha-galactosidase [Tetrabaena socialis]|eukprot:PNH00886.1 Alpha-galactosidase [Tetrabaena socialis]